MNRIRIHPRPQRFARMAIMLIAIALPGGLLVPALVWLRQRVRRGD